MHMLFVVWPLLQIRRGQSATNRNRKDIYTIDSCAAISRDTMSCKPAIARAFETFEHVEICLVLCFGYGAIPKTISYFYYYLRICEQYQARNSTLFDNVLATAIQLLCRKHMLLCLSVIINLPAEVSRAETTTLRDRLKTVQVSDSDGHAALSFALSPTVPEAPFEIDATSNFAFV